MKKEICTNNQSHLAQVHVNIAQRIPHNECINKLSFERRWTLFSFCQNGMKIVANIFLTHDPKS